MTPQIHLAPLTEIDIYPLWQVGYSSPSPEWKAWDGPYFEDYQAYPDFQEFKESGYYAFHLKPNVKGIYVNNEPVGIVTRHWQDQKTRWLEIGIVLYDPKVWNQSIGTTALRLWIEDSFQAIPEIQHLGLTTWSGNERMMKAALKVGMQEEGRIRQVRYWQGVYYDSMKYGITRQEWEQSLVSSELASKGQPAAERLAAFETMLVDLQKQIRYEEDQMAQLKAAGKEKTATYRQYFGNRSLHKQVLDLYKSYHLLDEV